MNKKLLFLFIFFFLGLASVVSQNVSLYSQFNGRYDFAFIGNTLNTNENGTGAPCTITTSSSATVNLNPSDMVEAAYLYWAGSGTGDFDVKLNDVAITATRQFSVIQPTSQRPFFSAFADITTQVQTSGNGNYTLSELDLTNVIAQYCPNGTNFGGWAIIIVYKNAALPLNQLNIYDGLQFVPDAINITLDSLNVIDNEDAKIGFVAWEGDRSIAENESLRINGNLISNPPLNPSDNAFNGTNSFTGSSVLYNMDLDVYNIQNNIQIGDESASIQLTSDRDFVMINAIVTKLNSQLPDATVAIENIAQECNTRRLTIQYSIRNFNATDFLPSGTFTTIYADGIAVGVVQTTEDIPIGETRNYETTVIIPASVAPVFDLQFIVDNENGVAHVTETNENNNTFTQEVALWLSPEINAPQNVTACNEGNTRGTFDFSLQTGAIPINPGDTVLFFENNQDAVLSQNPIINTTNYLAQATPKTIYVRIENEHCFTITHFELVAIPCPPTVYNYFTPNGDGLNDSFFVEGLRDVFLHFELSIYNRWGSLVWEGNNNTEDWDGKSNQPAILFHGNLPEGTYFYVLYLNEPGYPSPLTGWVFMNR
ncbi:T9SS type B sorting domain-containing protein [Flavobacterium humi]|uniref:T9SS type B sorting domain-containing protein n=1 Tax=Flavobacterium humi TaxID=2562683 RepID=A0A4Z0L6L7_9FLAO|nr:gliding motility-associated C-terminal domain-containing protein [Flavobacterium humi]TGD58156.1 T9SS type B sorting domain-containing protein [Flavobacterium humi]